MPSSFRLLLLTTALLGLSPRLAAEYLIQISQSGEPRSRPTHFAPGTRLTLSVQPYSSADSLPTAASYQWYHNEEPIADATSPEYKIAALTAGDAGNYRVHVTHGPRSEFSLNTVVINIEAPLPAIVDPTFTADLDDPGTFVATCSDGTVWLHRYPASYGSRQLIALDDTGRVLQTVTLPETAGLPLAMLADGTFITPQVPYRVSANGSALPFTLPPTFDPNKPASVAPEAPAPVPGSCSAGSVPA